MNNSLPRQARVVLGFLVLGALGGVIAALALSHDPEQRITNNDLTLLLLFTTVFAAGGLAVFDFRRSRSKSWSALRAATYLIVAIVVGAVGPLFSGDFGNFENGTSPAAHGSAVEAVLFAAVEIFFGVVLLLRSGRRATNAAG